MESVTIKLNGHEFTASRAPFGVLRALGKERNILDRAFLDADLKTNFLKLRENVDFYPAAYAVIAAHIQSKDGTKITAGEVAALCDSAEQEMVMTAEIFNALTTIHKLDYPEALEKKVSQAEAQA